MTALFFALIGMIYGRTHTRDIRELGGLMKIMPFLSVGYVIAGLGSFPIWASHVINNAVVPILSVIPTL